MGEKKSSILLLNTFSSIRKVIPRSLRTKSLVALVSVFINSLADLLGLASLIPLFMVIIDEKKIQESSLLQNLYQTFGFTETKPFIIFLCLLVLFFIIAKNLISLMLVGVQARFSYSLFKHISSQLYQTYYSRGISFVKGTNSNSIINNINSVAQSFVQFVVMSFIGVINELIVVATIMIAVLLYDPRSFFILMVTMIPIIVIFSRLVRKKLNTVGTRINTVNVQIGKTLFESVHGYVDVEIKNKFSWFYKKHRTLLSSMGQLQVKKFLFLQMPLKIIEVAVVFGLVVIILFSIWKGEPLSSLSVLLGVFGIAAYRILPSFNRLMVFLMNIRSSQYTFNVVEDGVSGQGDDIGDGVEERMKFEKVINIKDLSFSYSNNKKVLDDISFTIGKGERVGIIGKSGSGKTTMLNLLLRFYNQDEGGISVDGCELGPDNKSKWRNIIGYVPQETFLLDATLAENIALGDDIENIDRVKLNEVIKLASLEDFVASLKDGVDTHIGERGSKLSGGQRQRIGIARALYSNADVLFFDEATSALDNETEEEINNSIKLLSENNNRLTIVIIAHRITSLKHCTKIIELDQGKLVREWSYRELIEKAELNP